MHGANELSVDILMRTGWDTLGTRTDALPLSERAGHGREDAPGRLAALARSRRPQDKDQEDVEGAR